MIGSFIVQLMKFNVMLRD